MGGFGDAIKYLYSQFLLRDVLSFVVPGAIIIWTFLYRFRPDLLEEDVHWLLYIPIFGLLYVIGFAVQCLGEISGTIFTQRDIMGCWSQRRGLFWRHWRQCGWWNNVYQIVIKQRLEIQKQDKDNIREWVNQDIERLIVLKQMCGNNFYAFIIASLLFGFSYIQIEWLKILLVCLIGFFLLTSLFWGHRVHVLRYRDRTDEIQRQLTIKHQ